MSALTPGASPRLHALDGLRGVAALVVVAFHVLDYVALPRSLFSVWLMSPLGIFVNGPGAVHVFFVMSGFVLALASLRDPGLAGRGQIQAPEPVAVADREVAEEGLEARRHGVAFCAQDRSVCPLPSWPLRLALSQTTASGGRQ